MDAETKRWLERLQRDVYEAQSLIRRHTEEFKTDRADLVALLDLRMHERLHALVPDPKSHAELLAWIAQQRAIELAKRELTGPEVREVSKWKHERWRGWAALAVTFLGVLISALFAALSHCGGKSHG